MSRLTKLLPLVLLAAAGVLAGCTTDDIYDPNGYLARRDSIALSAGDANASNIAIQTVDPWPIYAGNTTIAYNGQRMQAAVERYRTNRVLTPQGMSPSGVYSDGQSQAPAQSSSGAPIGPTITQTK